MAPPYFKIKIVILKKKVASEAKSNQVGRKGNKLYGK